MFRMSLPESAALLDSLGQYLPFECSDEGEPLFSLEYAESLDYPAPEVVYDSPTEDGETVVRLSKAGTGWLFEISPDHRVPTVARVLADSDFRNAQFCIDSRKLSDAVFAVNNAAMLIYAFASCGKDTLELHSSVVSKDGRAYLFLGRSGAGKSTHSRQWLKYLPGTELMNDDNPILRIGEDGKVMIYGSPWSGKTPCYRNVSAPAGAFVQIRQCPENRIEPLSIFEAYAVLYQSCSGFKLDSGFADSLHATMEKVVTSVPFFVLDCTPDERAARICGQTVCN